MSEHAVKIETRVATPDDLAFVSQDGYVPAATMARKVAAGEVYICALDGKPIGYLRLEYLWSTTPYIALIRVLEPHRRMGAGRALLAFVERELRAAEHRRLFSSSQENEPEPQAWHRHMGFVDCGVLFGLNEDGSGEVFFKKDL